MVRLRVLLGLCIAVLIAPQLGFCTVSGETRTKGLWVPGVGSLLEQAGYDYDAPIQIHEASLSLENGLGERTSDSHFFVFSLTGGEPSIEKIAAFVYNHRSLEAISLLGFAPMLRHFRFVYGEGPVEYALYIPREFLLKEHGPEYVVYPKSQGSHIFEYHEILKADERDFMGDLSYGQVCSRILMEYDDVFGAGESQLLIDSGKFHLSGFKQVYPVEQAHR